MHRLFQKLCSNKPEPQFGVDLLRRRRYGATPQPDGLPAEPFPSPREDDAMRRRSFARAFACLALLLAVGLSVAGMLLRREPASYREITVPEGPERARLAGEFSNGMLRLADNIKTGTDDRWSESFTAEQMNCYFAHDFERVRPFRLPDGVHSPRVSIRPNQLRLAFRYGHDFFSSVVTVDLNVWLVANEANVVAVEVAGLHAGVMPVTMQSMLERIAEVGRQWNFEVNWYRHDGNPVALVRFQPDRPNPSVVLQRLELQDGKIFVEGKSTEPVPFRAMASSH
jgi:hypothetical protein